MDILHATVVNLTTPAVLAFAVGIVATLIKSDLKLPDQIAQAITVYLLLAIGLKGGVSLSQTTFGAVWAPMAGTLVLGIATPVLAFWVWRRIGRFGRTDSAALAAHYGSVSLVTFAESLNFLEALGVPVEGFMSALLTMLEIPAIIVALVIVKARRSPRTGGDVRSGGNVKDDAESDADDAMGLGRVLAHVLPEKSVVLLVGGLFIGLVGGKRGWDQISPFFEAPFRGILALFLLQMGVIAAGHLRSLRGTGWRLVGIAIALPIVNGLIGVLMGRAVGLGLGGATVLGCMAASASYIAAPAAVQMALPKANPGYYLPAAIGITFPFNVAFGIPLYYAFAKVIVGT